MKIEFLDLGLTDYQTSRDIQKQTFDRVKSGEFEHALISCQHQPVITLGRQACLAGRQAKPVNLLVSEEELKEKKIKLVNVERGGDITYHGPGQLTVYPIFNLSLLKKDIHLFIRNLEITAINTLKHFNINACQKSGLTGVWVNDKKIASIGIAIRQWITYHGMTMNVNNDDLSNFSLIRPCGMDIMMASVEGILGDNVEIEEVNKIFKKEIVKWPK